MAVDTFAKQLSLIHILSPSQPAVPLPSATAIAAADRQDFIWLYRGVLASAPPADVLYRLTVFLMSDKYEADLLKSLYNSFLMDDKHSASNE